jgi:hypothetical protein
MLLSIDPPPLPIPYCSFGDKNRDFVWPNLIHGSLYLNISNIRRKAMVKPEPDTAQPHLVLKYSCTISFLDPRKSLKRKISKMSLACFLYLFHKFIISILNMLGENQKRHKHQINTVTNLFFAIT